MTAPYTDSRCYYFYKPIGIGKPEPLLGNLTGYWSRRIDETHRLVYAVDDADLDVIACRGHYND